MLQSLPAKLFECFGFAWFHWLWATYKTCSHWPIWQLASVLQPPCQFPSSFFPGIPSLSQAPSLKLKVVCSGPRQTKQKGQPFLTVRHTLTTRGWKTRSSEGIVLYWKTWLTRPFYFPLFGWEKEKALWEERLRKESYHPICSGGGHHTGMEHPVSLAKNSICTLPRLNKPALQSATIPGSYLSYGLQWAILPKKQRLWNLAPREMQI